MSENLESWLECRDRAERAVPGYVEEEFRGYLECGILCFGFTRALCTGCGQGLVVAFSCEGLHPRHLTDVVGSKAAVDLQRGEPLRWEYVVRK